jgi:hypothetical protein
MMWGNHFNVAPIGLMLAAVAFGVTVVQIMLYPLRIEHNKASVTGEVILALVCLAALMPPFAETLGLVALLGIVFLVVPIFWPIIAIIALIVWYFQSKSSAKSLGTPLTLPKQYSLLEFLAVLISAASLPLLFSVFGLGDASSNFVFTLPLAVVLFLCAFSRLEKNKVPSGTARAVFLFLYPYMVVGTMYISMIFFLTVGSSMLRSRPPAPSVILLSLLSIVVAVGVWAAWQAKRASQHQSRLNYDSFYDSTQPP